MGRYTVSNAHQSEQQAVTLAVHPLRWVLNGEDLNSSTPLPSTASTTGMMGITGQRASQPLEGMRGHTATGSTAPWGSHANRKSRSANIRRLCCPGLHAVT